MKKVSVRFLLLAIVILSSQWVSAKEDVRSKSQQSGSPSNQPTVIASKAAGCEPSRTTFQFAFNDVSALLQQGGRMFQRPGTNTSGYEVPKGSGTFAIFAGSLWMGGVDANGQLKLAAVRFRQVGNDFWGGPLTVVPQSGNYNPLIPGADDVIRDFGPAEIDNSQCLAYDRFFEMRKGDVIQFKTWWDFEIGGTGTIATAKPDAQTMNRIINWPAHGDVGLGQDYFLAPFYDNNQNGNYEPMEAGDYPWYDDILGRDDIECGIDRRISLFGDETHWWVFNDKGNIHAESGGDPIGMEIRAQAFAFATNDEVNRMTFYNYEMINRGTQTLFETYFSQWLDPDLGNSQDDFVGCDVSRGLGFCYNGDNNDESASANIGYGLNPPAIGIDFFEGPYLDPDGFDNPGPIFDSLTNSYIPPPILNALDSNGIVYRGIGTGYSDGLIDNERFGMRRFTYFTNGASFPFTDPTVASQYYNFMQGSWANGSEMFYGGTGANPSIGVTNVPSDYMFPGDSDPLHWATRGQVMPFDWTEASTDGGTNSNTPADRRFVQSAGPFTLRPGSVNNITVGIVYGRGTSGDLFGSVNALKRADTKAQALFDACFKILDPPNAPRLRIQELENELILTLDNPVGSNNFRQEYEEIDEINIIDPGVDRFYRFEGYQIFQLVNAAAGVADIADPTKARLVAQSDLKNYEPNPDGTPNFDKPIDKLTNFEFDEELGFDIPTLKVAGTNSGIKHSYQIKEDLFAQGTRTLVNHKTYYYVAVSYAFNNFSDYDPSDPTKINGQKIKYIASRLGFDQTAIKAVSAIPHDPAAEAGGTLQFSEYGATPEITRLDGHGNGGRALELTEASENQILTSGFMARPVYRKGSGPINVKVVDPLNVADGYFECVFENYNTNPFPLGNAADTARWTINRFVDGVLVESVKSDTMISVDNEQLIPQWGVSVQILQNSYFIDGGPNSLTNETTDLIESSINFADSSKRWLSGLQDGDGYDPTNWIRSGNFDAAPITSFPFPPTGFGARLYESGQCYRDEVTRDPDRRWTKVVNGTMAPHALVGFQCDFMPLAYYKTSQVYPATGPEPSPGSTRSNVAIAFSPSVDIVITDDRSKWTQCPVIELGRDPSLNVGNARPGGLRKSPGLNKNLVADGSVPEGMSWFPGYAIDIETGARLNMAFGENSFLGQDNGNDMKWNPTANRFGPTGDALLGGMHPIYVFSHKMRELNGALSLHDMGVYTEGSTELYDLVDEMVNQNSPTARSQFYNSLTWVGYPILERNRSLFETEVRIKVRVNKEFKTFAASGENSGRPKFSWSMSELAPRKGEKSALAQILNAVRVVPNPYYAYSEYERNRLDTRVKITNLPEVCNINVYTTNGKLVRTFKKDSPITSIDWDLSNFQNIPVASGVYLIHVEVPEIGEKVLKFFCGIRQVDLQGI